MPIYEYRCPNGHTFEVFQRMSDPPASACEVCGASPVEKVLFPVAVHFKGSGFYATDYGRGSRKAAKDGESGTGSTDGSAAKETPAAAGDSKKGSDAKSSEA
ncbi:MAG TPA: zinc ribbon domain-containing protein [Gaiella sp.]|jgi:putative FmdB family regulatory protein|nr:zinc ribbon domain-containing protein [Gaiella sp.]